MGVLISVLLSITLYVLGGVISCMGSCWVSLISLHASLPSSTHITGRDWSYLRMQSCLLLLITHQQHLLLSEGLLTPSCLFHCVASSLCTCLMHVHIRTSVCAVVFAWNTYQDTCLPLTRHLLATRQLLAKTSHQPWRLEDTVEVKTGF